MLVCIVFSLVNTGQLCNVILNLSHQIDSFCIISLLVCAGLSITSIKQLVPKYCVLFILCSDNGGSLYIKLAMTFNLLSWPNHET